MYAAAWYVTLSYEFVVLLCDFSLLARTILLNLLPNICAGSLEIGSTNQIAEYFKKLVSYFKRILCSVVIQCHSLVENNFILANVIFLGFVEDFSRSMC